MTEEKEFANEDKTKMDNVNHPSHYADGAIEVIDYIRDKLTTQGFTEYCGGNVLKYVSRWRKRAVWRICERPLCILGG